MRSLEGPAERRTIGERVGRLTEEAGLSPTALAERARIDIPVLTGRRPVRLEEVTRLAEALGVPAGRLLVDTGKKGDDDA